MTWDMYMYDPYVHVIWECILYDMVHVYVRSVCLVSSGSVSCMTWYMYMYDPYVHVIWECILYDMVHVYVRSVCPCHLGVYLV